MPDGDGVEQFVADDDQGLFAAIESPFIATRYHSLVIDPATVPDELLLWFHRVKWDERMRSGRTLWEEMVYRYNLGVEQAHYLLSSPLGGLDAGEQLARRELLGAGLVSVPHGASQAGPAAVRV